MSDASVEDLRAFATFTLSMLPVWNYLSKKAKKFQKPIYS